MDLELYLTQPMTTHVTIQTQLILTPTAFLSLHLLLVQIIAFAFI
jgi:hypothetical protein